MSGLNLTRERVTKVGKISEASLREDWLAMYDLLKEIADDRPTCDGEINQLVKRIRALIGGE